MQPSRFETGLLSYIRKYNLENNEFPTYYKICDSTHKYIVKLYPETIVGRSFENIDHYHNFQYNGATFTMKIKDCKPISNSFIDKYMNWFSKYKKEHFGMFTYQKIKKRY